MNINKYGKKEELYEKCIKKMWEKKGKGKNRKRMLKKTDEEYYSFVRSAYKYMNTWKNSCILSVIDGGERKEIYS